MFKQRLLFFLYGFLCSTLMFAGEFVLKSSYPAEGQKISTLSRIDLVFDLSSFCTTEEEEAVVGIKGAFVTGSAKRIINIYKGTESEGSLLGSYPNKITKFTYTSGVSSASYDLGTTYELEDGQLYTIVVAAKIYQATVDGSTTLGSNEKFSITFYGGEEETPEKSIVFDSSFPTNGSEVNSIGVITLNFSDEIDVAMGAEVSLYNGSEFVKSAAITASSSDSKAAEVDFGDVSCSANSTYKVVVPQEAILLKGTETALSLPVTLTFTGYELFGYKSVSPASGSVLSSIGKVSLTPDFPDGRTLIVYAGDSAYYKPTYLYKGYKSADDMGELVGTYYTDAQTSSIKVNLKNTQLAAGETYALVLPQGTVPYPIDNGSGKLIAGYYSAADTILYIGANTAISWSLSEGDQLSKLGLVSFMTGGAATVNEGAKMVLYCGTDSVAEAEIKLSGSLCYADFGNLTLEQGASYSLVIPDGAIENMPKTTLNFTGVPKVAEYVNVTYKAAGTTVAAENVLKGSRLTFGMAAVDTLRIDSLMLNGAKVELVNNAYTIDSLAQDIELDAALTYIPTPEPAAPVYNVSYAVKASVTADGETTTTDVSSTTATVEQGKDYTFSVTTPDDNWTVDSVVVGTTPWTLADEYTVTIEGDTTITAYYSYAGEVAYVDGSSTGVFNINGKAIEIGINSGKIVVDGTSAGDIILLYAMNGAKMGQWTAQNIRESISVASGQYIVVVKHGSDKVAAKVSVNAY